MSFMEEVFEYIWFYYSFKNQKQIKLIAWIYLIKIFMFELAAFHPLAVSLFIGVPR